MTDTFNLLDVTCLPLVSYQALESDADVTARRARLTQPRSATTLQDPRRAAVRYQASERLRIAINTALALEMPLLVAGEPGTGKTQVAWFVAAAFGLGDPLVLPVRSTTTAQDLLYRFDAVGDFRDAHERVLPDTPRNRARHVHPGPLWQALTSETPKVLLVDEVDKAPRDFPNDLLDVLDRFSFSVPELERQTDDEVKACFPEGLTKQDGAWQVVGDPERRRPIVILGGAHDLAVLGDRALALENDDDAGRVAHELGELPEEGTLLVDRVEAFGLGLGQVNLAHRADAEALFFEAGDDLADQVLLDGIGLDDGKRALDGHVDLLVWWAA